MIHVVSTMTESRDHMNHVVSTKPVVSTTCFSQDYMAANLENQSLSRLAVTDREFKSTLDQQPGLIFLIFSRVVHNQQL